MIDFDWLSVLFGATGMGVLKFLFDIFKYYQNRKDLQNGTKKIFEDKQKDIELLFNDLISSAVKIQELIEEFVKEHDNIGKVLILKLENGGGVPQLGTVQHISILNEAINNNIDNIYPIKQDFQHYIIGAEYQKMLNNVLNTDLYITCIEKMDDGVLKKILSSNDMKQIVVTDITHIPSLGGDNTKGFLIYLSIHIKTDEKIDDKFQADIFIISDKIKKIFDDFYINRIASFD